MIKIKIRLLMLCIIIAILTAACVKTQDVSTVAGNTYKKPAKTSVPEPVIKKDTSASLIAVGDVLMHNNMIASGLVKGGTYNFDAFFSPVEHLIRQADYAIVNLEAPLAGEAAKYAGYPRFNSPDEITRALKKAGFDLVTTANNHIMDRGYKGAVRTLKVLKTNNLDSVGGSIDSENKTKVLIKEINNIKFAFIAYTFGTNGIPVPQDKEYIVNLLERDRVLADIDTVRKDVDVVVLLLHWGVEYQPQPTKKQREMAAEFFDAGADIIFGGHPHVIQPAEVIKNKGKDKYIIYSLGNFISAQRGIERNSGVIVKIKVNKDMQTGVTKLTEVKYTPTYSYNYRERGKQKFSVVPVAETMENIKSHQEKYLTVKDMPLLEKVYINTNKQLGKEFIKKDI